MPLRHVTSSKKVSDFVYRSMGNNVQLIFIPSCEISIKEWMEGVTVLGLCPMKDFGVSQAKSLGSLPKRHF
jgi:hypothetical protein